MANVKITDLTAYTDAASTDVLPIVDVSNNVTKKISISDILKATPAGTAALPAIAIDGDPNTGIWSPAADTLAVSTAGNERVRIDSSGRLLVGTSSARAVNASISPLRLQVEGTDYTNSSLSLINNQANSDGSYLVFGKSRGTTVGSSTLVNTGDFLGAIWFCGGDGTTLPRGATIEAFVDATPGANDMPGRLVFSTTADGASSPTERMRIRNDGAVFIGTTTGTINTTNYGTAIGYGAAGTFDTSRNVGAASAVASIFGNAGAAYVMGDGDLENTNNRYTGISDVKFKQNIENANSQWDDIKAVQVRKYELIADPSRKHIGCVAQELEQVCPGLVVEREDRDGHPYKSVAYSVLYMKAVKALQEAMERIEQLESEMAAVKAQLS